MKTKHKYIGLDVHKDQNQVAIAADGPDGEVRLYGSISNDLHAQPLRVQPEAHPNAGK